METINWLQLSITKTAKALAMFLEEILNLDLIHKKCLTFRDIMVNHFYISPT